MGKFQGKDDFENKTIHTHKEDDGLKSSLKLIITSYRACLHYAKDITRLRIISNYQKCILVTMAY